jgi:xylan 1,4-beta-xylosidase
MRNGKRVVMFREYLKDNVAKAEYQEIPDGEIILRISATELEYRFWLQEEGRPVELIASALTKNLSTEVIGGFTGVFVGMYVSGNGTASTNPADFDWFDYEEGPLN